MATARLEAIDDSTGALVDVVGALLERVGRLFIQECKTPAADHDCIAEAEDRLCRVGARLDDLRHTRAVHEVLGAPTDWVDLQKLHPDARNLVVDALSRSICTVLASELTGLLDVPRPEEWLIGPVRCAVEQLPVAVSKLAFL